MTSKKQAAANRINGRKSRGPRTDTGKARASRNAFRHGLASFSTSGDAAMAEHVKQVVGAICAGDPNPLLREQAVLTENQHWLSLVRVRKLALIERMLNPDALPLPPAQRRAHAKLLRYVYEKIAERRVAGLSGKRALPEGAWPISAATRKKFKERDGYAALRGAMDDLVRLIGYERTAWARRQKAVRGLMAIKFANLLGGPSR